jgi:L,D-peptidoglycan transpeptidase YkuD (ErfK/YbiS/YcfS/YnhG family)
VLSVAADRLILPDGRWFRCVTGRGGIVDDKCEGDGGTPRGCWPLRSVLFRPDRLTPPQCGLPVLPLFAWDGWCDAPDDARYNCQVALPYPASHERLWRTDALYDVIVVLGYNDAPVVPGRGSAIFMHVARPDHAPTEGCVALALPDLLTVLETCGADEMVAIR